MDKLRGRVTLTISLIALVVAGASLLERAPGVGAAPSKQPAQPLSGDHVLRVAGTSQMLATPNEAYVELGVVSRNKGAQTAMSQAGGRGDATLAAIKALDVAEGDIHQANAGLIYDPESKSYQAGTLFTIELEDTAVSKAGTIVDAAVKAGATKCASVYFALTEDAPAYEQALHAALENARKRGDSLAATTGVKITGVDSIDQASSASGYGGPPPYGPPPYGGPAPQPLTCGSSAPGPPGPVTLAIPQISVVATVTVVYTIG